VGVTSACAVRVLPFASGFFMRVCRMKCKRWIALAVLSRVEDTINQYIRTKSELEHLKRHKVTDANFFFLFESKTGTVGSDFLDSLSVLQANIKRVSKTECACHLLRCCVHRALSFHISAQD
jgi:hypothetical protein